MNKPYTKRLWFHVLLAAVASVVFLIVIMLLMRAFTRHGKEFEMPSFEGQLAQELTQRGREEGFVFVVNDHLYENGKKPGTVLKQDPAPGEKVKRGRKVYLTVAAAEPPTIKMPELHDISLRQAQIILEAQGLVLDRVIEKPSPYENVVLDVLYRGHSIASGTQIKMGEKISLVVGKDIGDLPDAEPVEDPNPEL
ncbi:MAG: PASTA domain-containing protein [Bacteroidales bacterium]|nr:PASTA domain-containing protein [Bacteroidales bacterium]MCR4857030.1 PASTA domain-containing protein [Bacteroidales bacterium]